MRTSKQIEAELPLPAANKSRNSRRSPKRKLSKGKIVTALRPLWEVSHEHGTTSDPDITFDESPIERFFKDAPADESDSGLGRIRSRSLVSQFDPIGASDNESNDISVESACSPTCIPNNAFNRAGERDASTGSIDLDAGMVEPEEEPTPSLGNQTQEQLSAKGMRRFCSVSTMVVQATPDITDCMERLRDCSTGTSSCED